MEPQGVENRSDMWCEECPKEVLLERWDRQIAELGLNIREYEAVEDIQRQDGQFVVTTRKGVELKSRFVILAVGKGGSPRRLKVPGEEEQAARISQNVADPDDWRGKDLVVFGAGDVACEAALALCDHNRVTMVAPDPEFTFPRQRNIDAVHAKVREGKIDLRLGHVAKEIGSDSVVIQRIGDAASVTVPADHIFRCIGAELPLKFFKRVGIRLEGSWSAKRWLGLAAMFALCYTIYGVKKDPPLWPFRLDAPGAAANWNEWITAVFTVNLGGFMAEYRLNGAFWYSLAYCLVMTWFGWKAYLRWGVGYDDSYQRWRYRALIGVQWIFGFILPFGVFWFVHRWVGDNRWLGWAGNSWHASGLEYAFPLFFHQFFWDVGLFYLVWGAIATLVIIPVLSIFHGKRYCTWFCGCGGLAETLGDRWRHLAPKGQVSRRWEWMNRAVLIWAVGTIVIVISQVGLGYWVSGKSFGQGLSESPVAGKMLSWYTLLSDTWLVGIIPVTLYPFFGGKIWCRYWCPLAKWMEMWSRWFGRLRIVSNDKCITCNECSRYCQVGIDVMGFAKSQQPFDNTNSSCIHCGICVTVCPMDVLSFESGPRPSPEVSRPAAARPEASKEFVT
jgi:polyferredoxin